MSISCQQCRERLGELLDAPANFISPAVETPATGEAAASLPLETTALTSIEAIFDSGSPKAEFSELTQHIESCPACRSDLTILRTARETLRALPLQTAPLDLRARVRAQIQSEALATPAATAQPLGVQQVATTIPQPRPQNSAQSTLSGWIEAWRHFFRRPASVAWASGLALAAFTVFVMQRNPNATFMGGREPLNDVPVATAPSPQEPPAASGVAGQISKRATGSSSATPQTMRKATPGIALESKPVPSSGGATASDDSRMGESTSAFRPPSTQRAKTGAAAPSVGSSHATRARSSAESNTTSQPAPKERILASEDVARGPRPQRPAGAARPKRGPASSAARATDPVAEDEATIRLVWLPPVPRSQTGPIARTLAAPDAMASTMARPETSDEGLRGGFITPRSLAQPDNGVPKSGVLGAEAGAAKAPKGLAAPRTFRTQPNESGSLRARSVAPVAPPLAASVAPSATGAPAPSASTSSATAAHLDISRALKAGAPTAAARRSDGEEAQNGSRVDGDQARGGGFGGGPFGGSGGAGAASDNQAFGAQGPRRVPANAEARSAAPGLADTQRATQSQKAVAAPDPTPHQAAATEAPVQRARISVVAPRDIALAQIEVLLPPGVRLSGTNVLAIPGASPHVLWRGSVRRGQSIETELALQSSPLSTVITTPSTTQLSLQLVDLTPPSHSVGGINERTLKAGQAAVPGGVAPRIVSRRSIAIPALPK
ncbi:MAG: hypothetical protein JWN98_918 [Abditibacteriota bacterium]|nr:hypothetical protein [Abditibacteriota bacterium]